MLKRTYALKFRRRRQGKTNYHKRLRLLQGGITRLVIRRTNMRIIAQLVDYKPDGDHVLATVSTEDLKKAGWKHSLKNIPAAYLLGVMISKKVKTKEVIADLGVQTSLAGSRLYAVIKGAIDAGMNINVDEKMFPSEERLKGAHIEKYRKKTIAADFEALKKKLMT